MPTPLKYPANDFVVWGSLVDLSERDRAWASLAAPMRAKVEAGRRLGIHIRPCDGSDQDSVFLGCRAQSAEAISGGAAGDSLAYLAVASDSGERLGGIGLVSAGRKLAVKVTRVTPEGGRQGVAALLVWHAVEQACGGPWAWLDLGASYDVPCPEDLAGFGKHAYPLVCSRPELPVDLRLTPFDTAAYAVPPRKPAEGRRLLAGVFGSEEFTVLPRAMYAIAACLREYREQERLTEDDEVLISSTTNTSYVSSCVTRAIEAVCRWSHKPSDHTRAVFLIHEFGFPNPRAAEMRDFCDRRGIPLIEDLAYGWGTEGAGTWGDVRVCSLTKLMPLQFGGVLSGMRIPAERLRQSGWNDLGKQDEILGLVAAHWEGLQEIRQRRQAVWRRYVANLASTFESYYSLSPGIMPGAFIARVKDEEQMKSITAFARQFNLEIGCWWHHAAIYVPCHQRLSDRHVDYISGAMLAAHRHACGLALVGAVPLRLSQPAAAPILAT
jgi:hypothetical protein